MEENNINNQRAKSDSGKYLLAGLAIIAVLLTGMFLLKVNNNSKAIVQNSFTPTGGQVEGIEATNPNPIETDEAEIQIIDVEAGSYYFKPNTLTVNAGQKVKIVMTSKDMMHDFVVDELGIKMPIVKSGNSGTVEFTANEKGIFEYYCSVGQHRSLGQVGKLIVE